MKILYWVIIVVLAIIVLGLGFFAYMGMFSEVLFKTQKMGPYTYAYVEHIGPYSQVGKPMAEFYEKMKAEGFTSSTGIGIYFDNPSKTPKNELRSEIGQIISIGDRSKLSLNKDKYNYKTLNQQEYITAEFPIKNALSYMFGPLKVYPAFEKYFKENNIQPFEKTIEIYDMQRNVIIFMMEK